MEQDVTLFAVFPHMHQLGIHLKSTAEPVSGEPRVLIDTPYSFEDQLYYPVNPLLTLKAGDKVSVECEYSNPGTETVTFGDSSLAEMCFTGLFRYPKGSQRFVCSTFGDGGRPILDGPACAKPGAPGNEHGVGKQCSRGGGECGGRDAGPGARICLADYTDGASVISAPCSAPTTLPAERGRAASVPGSSRASRKVASSRSTTADCRRVERFKSLAAIWGKTHGGKWVRPRSRPPI
jgi:hypothetical protein